jgi:hypothetical protein
MCRAIIREREPKVGSRSKKILICSNYAWTILNFRLPMILKLREAGFRVEVVT